MTYEETIDFLFSQLPIFQRIGKAAYKADLNSTHQIAAVLNHPELRFKSVHVAGTNGKGSVSHMLASIFQESGYKTGLYTSPHLKDFRERIKINGEMIPKEKVMEFVDKYQNIFSDVHPSFFEWTVGLSFDYFANEEVDIAIIETGMGGRLDSTNIINPEVSVITNIGFDHMLYLGDTLEKIAAEKAGIIKAGVTVVIGESQDETKEVFKQKAEDSASAIVFADDENVNHTYLSDLKGNYQKKNIKTVLSSIDELRKKGWKISDKAVEKGLMNTVKNTGLLGRWQELSKTPLIITDTAHNIEGLRYVIGQIQEQSFEKLHIVLGVVSDKDISSILPLFPKDATYYFCKPDIPRGLDAIELKTQALNLGLNGKTYDSVQDAYFAAKKAVSENDMIFIGGSTFVVAEVV